MIRWRVSSRLVSRKTQKEGIEFNEIFLSPVVRMTTVRVVLATCATYDLHLEQLDAAFLHGNLEEEIYMLQPEVPTIQVIPRLSPSSEKRGRRFSENRSNNSGNLYVALLLYKSQTDVTSVEY
ncbi:gag-pol polyprotein [Tanacetum coccineum]